MGYRGSGDPLASHSFGGMELKLLAFVSLLVLVGCADGSDLCKMRWEDCALPGLKIISVTITNCTCTPCQLIKGHNYSVTITFEPSKPSSW